MKHERGATDLVTIVGVVIGIAAGISVRPVVQKYFEGLLNADGLKQLGEKHRAELVAWFADFRNAVSGTIDCIQANLHLIHTTLSLSGKELAITLEVPTAFGELYVVLNHRNLSALLLKHLSGDIVSAVRFLYETGFTDGSRISTLL